MFQLDEKLMADNRTMISIQASKDKIDRTVKNGTINYIVNEHNDMYVTTPNSKENFEYNRIIQEEADGKIPYDLTFKGSLIIEKNLTVLGTETILNTEEVTVLDNIIELNRNETGSGITKLASGIQINRGTLGTANSLFDETHKAFTFDTNGNINAWFYEDGNAKILNDFDAQNITANKNVDIKALLTADGNTWLKSSLKVDGTTNLNSTLNTLGAATLQNTLTVTGATLLKSSLKVDGNTTLIGTLTATGDTTFNGKLNVKGATSLDLTLDVLGATNLKSTLDVTGNTKLSSELLVVKKATFNDVVDMTGTGLNVTNKATLGSLHVTGTSLMVGKVSMNNALDVSGKTSLLGAVDILGNTTATSMTLSGKLTVNNAIEALLASTFRDNVQIDKNLSVGTVGAPSTTTINGSLTTSGLATLKNTLIVEGLANLQNSLVVTGTAEVSGATELKGTLLVGGNTTISKELDVALATRLASSLDVTGVTKLKSTLDVTGNTALNSMLTVTGNTILDSTLLVKGNSNFRNVAITDSGSAFNKAVTIVDVASPYALSVTGLTKLDTLKVLNGLEVNNADFNGPVHLLSTLEVDGITTLNSLVNTVQGLNVGGALNVTLNTSIDGNLTTEGNTSLIGTLDVANKVSLGNELAVAGNTVMNGSFDSKGSTAISGILTVSNLSTFSKNVTIDSSDLFLNKNTSTGLGGNLSVDNIATFKSNVTIGGTLNIQGKTTTNAVQIRETLQTDGVATFKDNVDITKQLKVIGASILESTLTTTGATTLKGILDVTGATTLSSTLNVTGATTLSSTLAVSLAATMNNSLLVKGTTTLDGVLKANNTVTFEKAVTINGDTTLVKSEVSGATGNLNVGGATVLNTLLVNSSSTLQGDVTLGKDPTVPMHAVTKKYVDYNFGLIEGKPYRAEITPPTNKEIFWLNEGILKFWNKGTWDSVVGGVSSYRSSVTVTAESNTVTLDLSANYKEVDMLMVYQNGVYLNEGTDYTFLDNVITKSEGVWKDTIIEVILMKNVNIPVVEFDGNLIKLNTISESKLDAALIDKLNNHVHAPTSVIQNSTNRFVTDVDKNNWNAKATTAVATQATNGLMSAADKTKMDSLAMGSPTQRFVTDAQINLWTHDRANIINIGTTEQDPNLSTSGYILTNHANSPNASYYWHVETRFYSTRTNTSNVSQTAIQYNGGGAMYVRSRFSNAWTAWKMLMPYSATVKTAGEFYGGAVAPTAANRLNYDGYLYATRVYNAVYNDYAEYFEKGKDILEPGDIVMLNPDSEKEEYIKSTIEHSHLAIGVVSDEYGQCLGGNGDGNDDKNFSPVGLAGRVRVKVTGPVNKGDYITTSNIDGIGVAVISKEFIHGTVIGMALESSNDNGIKRIRMLIKSL
jgi:cytoskeletal protein CcmA (bactofilin family)